jgi:thiol-disulfide isomerase/thioredoxin
MRFSVLAMLVASALASAPTLPPDQVSVALADVPIAFVMAFAPWCGHCVQVKPEFEAVESKIPTYMVDASTPEAASFRSMYQVRGFPTFMLLEHGKLAETYEGDRSKIEIELYLSQRPVKVQAPAEAESCATAPST